MKTFILDVLMMAWEGIPVVKQYEVRAVDFWMAAGMCKGQAAVNGWKVLEIKDYTVKA